MPKLQHHARLASDESLKYREISVRMRING